jgi:hypothetical protein
LTQFSKEGGNDIKVEDIIWIQVKILMGPLVQDVQKDQTVNKYWQGASTVIVGCHIAQDLEETSSFWLNFE